MAVKYTGAELRWHFRNGTYKEIAGFLASSPNSKILGKLYRRQDGRCFSVMIHKDLKSRELSTYLHEVLPDQFDQVLGLYKNMAGDKKSE